MIYLIDDNQNNQRQREYGIHYIEEGKYEDYLTSIEKLPKKGDMETTKHLQFLENADCILLHKTTEDIDSSKKFISGSTTNVIKIKELIAKEGNEIPLVMFSLGMNEVADYNYEENPNFISGISKNIFYKRLQYFIEHYKITGLVELRLFAYGKNYKYFEIDSLADKLLESVATVNEERFLNISHIPLNDFRSFFQKSNIEREFDDILNEIEDDPITIREYKNKINTITQSFREYGKNLYGW